MKNHVKVPKALAAFVASVFVVTFVCASLAIAQDVIPNFTALKVGEPGTEPLEGEIYTEGKIVSEEMVQAIDGTVRGAILKASTLMPTAASMNFLGHFNVSGNLNVDSNMTVDGGLTVDEDLTVGADLVVDGGFEADSIGNFYRVVEICSEGACVNDDAYYWIQASCEEGDIAIDCGFTGMPGNADYPAGLYSFYVEETLGTCTAKYITDMSGLAAFALCFSPDGEAEVGGVAEAIPAEQNDGPDLGGNRGR
ncbi:hypothetical protein KJ764_02170 [Patescibacteria group bacterium]|nr:hypothetical protein [Patescibacteria group bacterium]